MRVSVTAEQKQTGQEKHHTKTGQHVVATSAFQFHTTEQHRTSCSLTHERGRGEHGWTFKRQTPP